MFILAVPDNRRKKDGYYCSLVESRRVDGFSMHETVLSFGFIPAERLPYLKAAFNLGDPEAILEREKHSQEQVFAKRKRNSQITTRFLYTVQLFCVWSFREGDDIKKDCPAMFI